MLIYDIGKLACKSTDENGIDHFYGHPAISTKLADQMLRSLKFDNKTRERVVTFLCSGKYLLQLHYAVGICLFIFLRFHFIYLGGGDFMKNQPLSITERHLFCVPIPNQTIRKTITAWLTKELHK